MIDGDLVVSLAVPDTPNVAGEFQLGLDISATRTQQIRLDVGTEAAAHDLVVSEPPLITVTTTFEFDGVVELDLAQLPASLNAAFLEIQNASARVMIDENLLDKQFSGRVGLFGVDVLGGSFNIDASLSASVIDVNNRLTLAEVFQLPLTDLITVDRQIDAQSIVLPVTAVFGSQSLSGISLDFSSGLFDRGTELVPIGFAQLDDFRNFDFNGLAGAVEDIGRWLDDLGTGPLADAALPLAVDPGSETGQSRSLQDVLDFAGQFESYVPVKDDNGQVLFDTIQDFAAGLPAVTLENYDAAADELTFQIAFSPTLPSVDANLDIDFDLGELAGINTSGTLSLLPTLRAEMNVVLDLSPLGGGFQLSGSTLLSDLNAGIGVMFPVGLRAANPLPLQDGVLPANVTFDVTLGAVPGSESAVPDTTSVTVAAEDTGFNATAADLLRDVNDALAVAGLSDFIEASLDDQQRIMLVAVRNEVTTINVDHGEELGFSGAQAGSDLGLADIEITLRDGTAFAVDLDGSANVQDVIDRIGTALLAARTAAGQAYDPNELVISIDSESSSLILTDNTSESTVDFEVRGINGSLVGMSLGILAVDDDGDGVIEGMALHGDTLAKHILLESPILSGGIQLVADDFNASANFGFVGVSIENGSVVDLDGGPSGLLATVNLVDSSGQPVTRVP